MCLGASWPPAPRVRSNRPALTAPPRAEMPAIAPAFVQDDSKTVYRVSIDGHVYPFDAPVRADAGRKVVKPFQTRSDACIMKMEPLPQKAYNLFAPLQRMGTVLEHNATQVTSVISTFGLREQDHVCALVMIAWYLIDDDANIMNISDKLDFTRLDVAVWAVLAVFRNVVGLRPRYLSHSAASKYINCFHQLVGLLNTFNVVVTHASHHPE